MDEFREDEDDWVKMAEAYPSLVADLLLRLRDAPVPPPPPPPPPLCPFPSLRLTVHRPRSNLTKRRSAADIPFLWRNITIHGRREAPKPVDDDDGSSRSSKVDDQSATVSGNNNDNNSSNKKRTFDELKEKTSSLLKQGSDLKKELASLHFSNKKPRAAPTPTPESLKLKLKINLATGKVLKVCSTSAVSEKTITDLPQLVDVPCTPSESVSLQTAKDKVSDRESSVCAANASSKQQEISNSFFLPDLNLPLSEDLD